MDHPAFPDALTRASSRDRRSRCSIGFALALVGALAGTLLAASAESTKPKLTIGVLRRDGIVVPFAAYDNGDWSAPWPGPLRGLTLPLSMEDVPKKWWGAAGPAAAWKAWPAGAREGTDIALQRLVEFPVFCTTRLGLLSSYPRGLVNPREPTVPKGGLAIGGDATVLPIDVVAPDSATGRELLTAITDKFNDAEEQASRSFTKWKHPITKAERARVPIRLEAIYQSSETTARGAWTVAYLEAVRTFIPGPTDEGCGLITYAHAWVRRRPGKDPDIDLGARITYCDREGVAFMLPLGRLALKNDVYWVFQMSSWRDEVYFVTRMRPDESRPVVAVSGGECERGRQ
jgi:hypothetical protein